MVTYGLELPNGNRRITACFVVCLVFLHMPPSYLLSITILCCFFFFFIFCVCFYETAFPSSITHRLCLTSQTVYVICTLRTRSKISERSRRLVLGRMVFIFHSRAPANVFNSIQMPLFYACIHLPCHRSETNASFDISMLHVRNIHRNVCVCVCLRCCYAGDKMSIRNQLLRTK